MQVRRMTWVVAAVAVVGMVSVYSARAAENGGHSTLDNGGPASKAGLQIQPEWERPPNAPLRIKYPTESEHGFFSVTWDPVSGAAHYVVERSPNRGRTWRQVYRTIVDENSYPEGFLFDGKYRYRVKATSFAGDSGWCTGTRDCIVGARRPPPKPPKPLPPPKWFAHVSIEHPYRGDLVVTVGVGDPAAPLWSTVVSNRQGGADDNITADVGIDAGKDFLPPSAVNRWFLKVVDEAAGDVGEIQTFRLYRTYPSLVATDTPIAIPDVGGPAVCSFIPSPEDACYVMVSGCRMRPNPADSGGKVTVSAGGQVRAETKDVVRVVGGFRDAAEAWAGGEPVIFWSGVSAGAVVPWGRANQLIMAPDTPGTYHFWAQAVVAGSDDIAISAFKSDPPTPGDPTHWKWGTALQVQAGGSPPAKPRWIRYRTWSKSGTFDVTWAAVSEATLYTMERSSDKGGAWQPFYAGPATSWSEDSLPNGKYRYRVRAVNLAGESPWRTGTHDCAVFRDLVAPAKVQAKARGKYTFLSWKDTNRGENGYIIQWKKPGRSEFAERLRVKANYQSAVVQIPRGTTFFRICAHKGKVKGPYSAVVSAKY